MTPATRNNKPRILVTGGTGTVGGAVLRQLDPNEHQVLAFVRDPAATLPTGVTAVLGDLRDRAKVDAALDGVDAAFFLSPHIVEEESCAEIFTEACAHRRVRMVFLGSHIDHASRFVRWALRKMMGILVPEFRAKFRLSEKVRRSAARPVVLAPSNYFQNDEYRVVQRIMKSSHRYVMPLRLEPKNRIDVLDIAAVAARALVDPSVASGAYSLVGPVSLSGPDCAVAWSKAIGEEVRYEPDPALWTAGLAEEFTGQKLEDILATYRMLEKVGVPTTPAQVALTTELLGHPPRSYESYVARVIAARSRSDGACRA